MPRYCFTGQVRPDKLAEYTQAHAAVWPEMLVALQEAGWRNYRLYLSPNGLLVGHFEADDCAAAQAAVQRTAINSRWQEAMRPYFLDHSDERFEFLTEVFSLEDQRAAADLR